MQENWSNVRLKIPTVCPSLLDSCRLIKLDYILRLVVNVSTLSINKQLDIPIVIGTVPLNESKLPANPDIRYYKSILERRGKSDQNLEEEENDSALIISEGNSNENTLWKFKPKYPYYKDFSLDR